METLFRFNIVRDAQRSNDEVDPIELKANSQFQQAANAIPAGPNRRDQLKALAQNFIASPNFIGSPEVLPGLQSLDHVASTIDGLIDQGKTTRADLANVLPGLLNAAP